jgi:hypothetical protein
LTSKQKTNERYCDSSNCSARQIHTTGQRPLLKIRNCSYYSYEGSTNRPLTCPDGGDVLVDGDVALR